MKALGTVFIVGAGPGNPDLITVRGLTCLREADVVMHGAGTVRADPLSARVPPELVSQRVDRGLSPQPLGAIVTRSAQ